MMDLTCVRFPKFLRPSIGTAAVLGLKNVKAMALPRTAYIMLGERCQSNCSFCAQRSDGRMEGILSRVVWPRYEAEKVIKALLYPEKKFQRVCIQTLDYPELIGELRSLLERISGVYPISVSIVPIGEEDMLLLKEMGVEYLSIALDAASRELFKKVKGSGVGNRFTWEDHWNSLINTVKIFGKGNTHLIVGLGESDMDLIETMIKLRDLGIYTALFAYTPINGGNPPKIGRYRAIQIAHSLIYYRRSDHFVFDGKKLVDFGESLSTLRAASQHAFLTSGCPGCNRPFYNERPGKELYNYPYIPDKTMIEKGLSEAINYINGK